MPIPKGDWQWNISVNITKGPNHNNYSDFAVYTKEEGVYYASRTEIKHKKVRTNKPFLCSMEGINFIEASHILFHIYLYYIIIEPSLEM